MDAHLRGVEQLQQLGAALKSYDDRKFKASVTKRFRELAKPAGRMAQENANRMLPHRGGLNHMLDTAKVGARVTLSGSTAGVRVTMRQNKPGGTRQRDLVNLDAGLLRHPVHADPRKTRKQWSWVNQPVTPGFWSKAMHDAAPLAQEQALKVLDDVSEHITSKIRGRR